MTIIDEFLGGNSLLQVNRPARYSGGEWNSIRKDWDGTEIRVVLSYPDVYEIGMSNMALPILYDILNRQPDVLAERVFAPWGDMEALLRARGIPLFSLENRRPLADFDIIGFSLGYELTYTNVLNMLDLAGIPILRTERDDRHPLVIAGGSCCLNPEAMSDFIDAFIIGDGEEVLPEPCRVLRDWKREKKRSKAELLRQLAKLKGVYLPGGYRVAYGADGRVESITPESADVPARVTRRVVSALPPPFTRPVVPFLETVHDRGAIEIQRGCTCGCRFCQAGMLYRPLRERPHDEVVAAAGELIRNCGYDEISLVSLNTSDYPGIEGLVKSLAREYPRLTISVPSLRLDTAAVALVGALPGRSRGGFTFAPEAGTERLRNVINKNITEEGILETAAAAFSSGANSLKLYFMLGLPTETPEDIEGIGALVTKIRATGRQTTGKTPQLRISAATFVPKSHSPFQWAAQDTGAVIEEKLELLRRGLSQKGVRLSWHDPKISLLEAVMARGDRRLGKVIYQAWRNGARLDAWTEYFRYEENWLPAFAAAGIDPAFYAQRERSTDEVLPWSHIDAGISPAFLKAEYRRAMKGEVSRDCRHDACHSCGLQRTQPSCREKLPAKPGNARARKR
ncbi:MAG: TIGR03960 family B12-binding radical SAM protein [Chloroflexota bacterium]